ncbi:MAG TPA: efflux RND transporter periplasmic adaptor subunit [Noviherbaspirillum sp.]
MKLLSMQRRTLALLAVLLPLLVLFAWVALRSGPLAPVPVTAVTVESRSIAPALFGIGTVESRYTYRIGPTIAGRIRHLDVHVGDHVKAGQVLGEMDPVDIDDRIRAQEAALKRAEAQLLEAQARQAYAQAQARRYEQLLAVRSTSEEILATKQHELRIAEASLNGVREELSRVRADREALIAQRRNLRLTAPFDGLVAARNADPGTTVVAGQTVVELIDPKSLWINVRFDQSQAHGLAPNLPARITLRSRGGTALSGRVLRIEPVADAVTEETLAKVVFDQLPDPLPPLGELAEVTGILPPLPAAPIVPNAAVQRVNGTLGVWKLNDGNLHFAAIVPGGADLDGHVQVREGLKAGDRVVVHTAKALNAHSRIHVVDRLPGVKS